MAPRTVVFVQWTAADTKPGFKEEDFCKEIDFGWIPRVGDTMSFRMDDYSEPFCLYSIKVISVEWFEDEPSVIEVCMEYVQPEQPKDEFIALMKSLGWMERPDWENCQARSS
jgi:hypothetical protein